MNHIYRLVWSQVNRAWVAVAENARGHGKSISARKLAAATALLGSALLSASAFAADAGNATVVGGQGSVNTAGNTTTINQSSQRLAIDWSDLSTAANEALVFKQPNAQAIAFNRITGANPSNLLGSLTANGQVYILNPNGVLFGAGAQVNVGGLVASTLTMDPKDFMNGSNTFTKNPNASGSVVNQGALNAADGGYIALLGATVSNEGTVKTPLGSTLLAAGDKITLNLNNGSLLGYTIDQGALQALVENKQLIQADGGQVLMAAKALDKLSTAVINNTGVIEARTVQNQNGRIMLIGDMDVGTVNPGGTLDASAPSGGDGGFVETSAANVNIADDIQVTTAAAPGGKTGKWLIDPNDFRIAATGGNMSGAAVSASLANTDFQIQTATMGTAGGNGDITIDDAVTWSSAHTLTLSAERNININRSISALNANGKLALEYGLGRINTGNPATYNVDAPINLQAGQNFSTRLGSDGATVNYQVITALGDGTATGTDLRGVIADMNGHYALGADIDARTWSLGASGDDSLKLENGVFDGLGHVISNLNGFGGLFSYVNTGGVLRNLGLVNAYITNGQLYEVGMMVDTNFGQIDNVYANGILTLVNNNLPPGDFDAGGLVGYNGQGSTVGRITNSYVTGTINGTASNATNVGGMVGYNEGEISYSYAAVDVSSSSHGGTIGGLVGMNDYTGNIYYSYATGDVNLYGGGDAGGLAGIGGGSLKSVYASGKVSAFNISSGAQAFTHIGGLTGEGGGFLGTWDITTTGQASGDGVYDFNMAGVAGNAAYSHASYGALGTWSETAPGSGVWVAVGSSQMFVGAGVKAWVMIEGSTRPFLYTEYSTNIGNAHQLQLMALAPGASYALSGNIDALATAGGGSGMWSTQGFAPVGNTAAAFAGSFDGQGNQISDLFINRPATDNVGLFGVSSGTIGNVGLIDANVTGGNNVGALVGWNNGWVNDAFSDGSVKGTTIVGGLVGENSSYISDAHSDADVVGANNVGGLVGSNLDVGGVDTSYTQGNVKATDSAGNAGGLAGNNDGDLTDVYATGDVGGGSAGGLVGQNGGSILRAYAIGDVTGIANAGGLVGINRGGISSAYASGHVMANGAGNAAGGLIGRALSGASDAYWDGTTSGQAYAGGAQYRGPVNISGNAVYQHATYANLGTWNETASGSGVWVATDANGPAWVMIEGSTRPFLYSEYSSSIGNAHQLQLMALNTGANYTLASDIDAGATSGGGSGMWSTQGFSAIGNGAGAYTGVFDGQDNVINDLVINRAGTDNVGLFGISTGTVRHVGLDGGSVSGGNVVGGLIGSNAGVVSDVFTTGNITGAGTVGGIVGVNGTGGAIDNAHVEGLVTATGSSAVAGGLVGQNDGAISLAYSVGTVSSQGTAGGLVGTNSGSVDATYASGKTVGGSVAGGLVGVNNGSVTNSDWDTLATGVAVGAGSGSAAGMTNIRNQIPPMANPTPQAIAANPAFGAYSGLGTWTPPGNGGGVMYATDSSGNITWVTMSGSTRPFLYSEYTTTIRNAHQLQLMMVDPSASYTLANDIDASLTNGSNIGNMWNTLGFMPIGTGSDFSIRPFTGNFNGRNHVISNLVVNRAGMLLNAGLFAVVYGSDIRNVGMEGGSIASDGSAGGLIGLMASGHLSNAYATGTVSSGDAWAGGLIGSGSGSVDNVYATGDVSGNIAGGLLGYNNGEVSNAYATGNVLGQTAGGLIGQNYGSLADSYAAGNVRGDLSNGATSTFVGGLIGEYDKGTVSSSFWNTQTSGIGIGVGVGTGTTGGISGIDNTAASQLATYTNAGWDIDDAGGTGSAWRIYDGQTGPLLRSFLKAVTVTASAKTKTYDGQTDTASAYTTDNGAVLNGDLEYVTSRNAGSYSASGGTLKQTGLYSGQQGYDISYNDASLTISKASVTLSNTSATKIYDGTVAANSSMIATAGQLFGGDTAIASGYVYGDKNAGSNKTVTASGVGINDGNWGNNYNITYVANTHGSIAKADVTLGTADVTKTYDGTTAASGAISVVNGTVFSGDSISGGSLAFTDKNAGTGDKTVTVGGATVGDGVNNANYNVTYANNTTSTINKADLIVTAQQESKTYDGTVGAVGSGIAGSLAGAGAGDVIDNAGTQAFLDKNAGSGNKTVVADGVTIKDAGNADMSGNYNIIYVANTTSTIDKAALTVGANGIDRVYDGMSDAAVTFSDNRIAGDQLTIVGNAAFADKNAGSNVAVNVGNIALSGADSGNYRLTSTSAATSADITQATATVTANSAEKFYDGKAYTGGAGLTVSGLVGGDTLADLGTLNYGGLALGASGIGSYAITPNGAGNGNYRLVFVDGKLTIKALSQTSAALGGAAMEQAYNAAQQGVFGSGSANSQPDGAGGQKSSTQRSEVLTMASSGDAGAANVPSGGSAVPVQQITPRLSFSGCGMGLPDGSGC